MKITKDYLKQVIKEEITRINTEGYPGRPGFHARHGHNFVRGAPSSVVRTAKEILARKKEILSQYAGDNKQGLADVFLDLENAVFNSAYGDDYQKRESKDKIEMAIEQLGYFNVAV